MKKILVLANDGGGGELLCSMISEERDRYAWNVVVPYNSPAHSIFTRKGLRDCLSLCEPDKIGPDYFNHYPYDIILYNPGWSDFPRSILNKMNPGRRKTLAILEHWMDYRERFGHPAKGWRNCLPDFTVVCDNKAYELASGYGLPNVVRLKNYYLSEQLNQFQKSAKERNNNPDTLLFLSQTVSDAHMRRSCKGNFTYIGRHEKDAIIEIVNNFDRLAEHFGVHKMKIRLHPSERQFRHKDIIKRHEGLEFEVEQAHDCELLESIANTRVVIGMTSIALFISYICGKPTISFIPEASVKCTLPLPPEICVHSISEICRIPYETFTKHGEQINLFLNRNLESLFMKIEKGQAL